MESGEQDDSVRQVPPGWTDEHPEQRRSRIRDPEKAALLRSVGIPQRLIGPTPPDGWRVIWSRTGRPIAIDPQGREAGWFLDVLAARARDLAYAQRDGIPFSWWPREQ